MSHGAFRKHSQFFKTRDIYGYEIEYCKTIFMDRIVMDMCLSQSSNYTYIPEKRKKTWQRARIRRHQHAVALRLFASSNSLAICGVLRYVIKSLRSFSRKRLIARSFQTTIISKTLTNMNHGQLNYHSLKSVTNTEQ
uniref:Uncharacterized protein n=1 Tax=Ascaris lumbricoides TaxID=6252 RepID=A0A9J2PEM2_ASCLU